ncbi:MAG: cytochrome c [Acidobacteria bacterium]|nr:cytochrome c [Acidobacteriota bacterium]
MIKRAQVLTLALGVSVAVFAASAQGRAVPEPPTFARDIAPIIFQNCSHCHRPGESGPFNLLTYGDLRKRARQIVEVTRSGFMPPWLPEPGYGEFAGERRLTREQIATLATWAEGGTPLGDPQEIPPLPEWTEGWQLGEPDLVIRMEQPYLLTASGAEVFRNFIIPIPVTSLKYVKAVELRPGNPQVVHHAVMRTDETRSSRQQAALDPEMGFGNMTMGTPCNPTATCWAGHRAISPSPGAKGSRGHCVRTPTSSCSCTCYRRGSLSRSRPWSVSTSPTSRRTARLPTSCCGTVTSTSPQENRIT